MAGFSLPTVGQPNSTEDAKVLTALTGLNDLAAAYRTVVAGGAGIGSTLTTQLCLLTNQGTTAVSGAAPPAVSPLGLRFLTADNAITGLTQFMRIRFEIEVGSTSPGTSVITAGLYPVTISAGNYVLGAVIAGTTVASSGLATNTVSPFTGTDFNVSALTNGSLYALGFATSVANMATNVAVTMQLQVHNT